MEHRSVRPRTATPIVTLDPALEPFPPGETRDVQPVSFLEKARIEKLLRFRIVFWREPDFAEVKVRFRLEFREMAA